MLFSLCCRYSSKAARGRPYSCKLSDGPAQCRTFGDLTDCVFPMLFNLGPNLSFDPILMAKVIRVGRAFLKEVLYQYVPWRS
jgi:THO complex subunit 2